MYGVHLTREGATFSVWAPDATAVTLCLFDEDGHEHCHALAQQADVWQAQIAGAAAGQRYGFRADGPWAPEQGLCFDPAKLLVDPWASAIDRPFVYDPQLAERGVETAPLVPRSVVTAPLADLPPAPPHFRQGALIYELNVRGFTVLHPDVPPALRGTVAALAHPAVIAHLQKLHVGAVELMPIVAWIDERHLVARGLANAWGYNPIAPMALDPRLCPGGMAELRETVACLHEAGIGVILDLVFNHTGESDRIGPTLSMRGLGERSYYALEADGDLVNVAGTGNTLDFTQPAVRALALDTLRRFVREAGVDGFRFDLAPILARGPAFDPQAPIFDEIARDPWLADRILIAEPWDIGADGYQLGRFPESWLEWNDRYRDDVRRFWRGDGGIGAFVTRLAGSSDIFGNPSRSVNFLASHDGFTLADTVAYVHRHNLANGEHNRDGHGENFSWNHGVEGPSDDPAVIAARGDDLRALLATLFASSGTIMLTAGDEFGRTQQGNNNAYAQDNPLSWVAWHDRDTALEAFACALSAARAADLDAFATFPEPGRWFRADGADMSVSDWESAETGFVRYEADLPNGRRFTLLVDRAQRRLIVDIVRH
ncbi:MULTISPECIES: glycogen debranching protein GlgX [unclassified Sphingobium]|uniref:glycogen debranching protein GlgX n=1 Tax=unclassified Sphingobium TaxID=2611147 RepID=UPI00222428E4|nr:MULTISPECIES: glycogen debranching protein GlgX [unclassified Sphingobium]MCW2412767.1 glycogen operon protein [Sphingobium sp. B8D3D]MCW2414935.1 glycogen operon protein [Sphingobium sp. B8D3A]